MLYMKIYAVFSSDEYNSPQGRRQVKLAIAPIEYSDQTCLDLSHLKMFFSSLLCGNLGFLFLAHANICVTIYLTQNGSHCGT